MKYTNELARPTSGESLVKSDTDMRFGLDSELILSGSKEGPISSVVNTRNNRKQRTLLS